MTRRDWQLSEPAKIAAGSLTEETLDERFFRVPTAFQHLAIEFSTLRFSIFEILVGRLRVRWRSSLAMPCTQRDRMHPRFDDREQLPDLNGHNPCKPAIGRSLAVSKRCHTRVRILSALFRRVIGPCRGWKIVSAHGVHPPVAQPHESLQNHADVVL